MNKIKAVEVSELDSIAINITTGLSNIVDQMLFVGNELTKARAIHPGDKEFGQWCKEKFPNVDRKYLYRLRAISEDSVFGVRGNGKLSFGQMAELLPAPDSLKEEMLDYDGNLSREELRRKVKLAELGQGIRDDLARGDKHFKDAEKTMAKIETTMVKLEAMHPSWAGLPSLRKELLFFRKEVAAVKTLFYEDERLWAASGPEH